MNILLTNDDGIYAPGIWALYRRLALKHAVTVIAPDRERSAVGHSITLHQPLRLDKVAVNGGFSGYAVSGTPVDCVRLGLLELLETRPDLAISGINPGANVGININYSGTVAAAREAAVYGIPAMAVSVQRGETADYEAAARVAAALAELILREGLPAGTILNVNLPDAAPRQLAGVKISRQGMATFSNSFDKRVDPRNRTYYWQGSELKDVSGPADVDGAALSRKFISITPIQCDMTDYKTMADLKNWHIAKEVL